ncbi:hypothetical protein DFH28DRAFT_1018959 [Melampsora americana]|nr:hypothetical protein DFH28DRAFT_1018959 [Melampsora americana]
MVHTGWLRLYDIFDPLVSPYSISAKNLLQVVSTFTNLTTLQYFSRDTSSTFEDVISKVASNLSNLEVLVIARLSLELCGWDSVHERLPEAEEIEWSNTIGERLSSMQNLKRLHLQGLYSPRASWGKLNWKCPLEYLKVAECLTLHRSAILTFALAFRKTLLGLVIGINIQYEYPLEHPKTAFGKDFEVLEELHIRGDLDVANPGDNYLDDLSQAPKLKHLHLPYNEHGGELAHIKQGIEKPQPVWPSLQTLVVWNGEAGGRRGLRVDLLDNGLKNVTSKVSHKFGLLDAEQQWEDLGKYDRTYAHGKMTLSNGRVIEFVELYHNLRRIGLSLEFFDTTQMS